MLLEEGQFVDAVAVGVKAGFQAFCVERTKQKAQTEEKVLTQQLMNTVDEYRGACPEGYNS